MQKFESKSIDTTGQSLCEDMEVPTNFNFGEQCTPVWGVTAQSKCHELENPKLLVFSNLYSEAAFKQEKSIATSLKVSACKSPNPGMEVKLWGAMSLRDVAGTTNTGEKRGVLPCLHDRQDMRFKR